MNINFELTTGKLTPNNFEIIETGMGSRTARLMLKNAGIDTTLDPGAQIWLRAWKPERYLEDPPDVEFSPWDAPVDPESDTAYTKVYNDLELPKGTLMARIDHDPGTGEVEGEIFHLIVMPAGATAADVAAAVAALVTITPVGSVSSSDVQGAIQELDAEKLPKTGGTMTGNLVFSGGAKATGLPTPTNPSDAASKSYVDGLVDPVMKAPQALDCSANPNYPTAQAGDTYRVTVAGKVGGASGTTVNVGDLICCHTDTAGGTEAAVGSRWFVVESNRDQSTETVLGLIRLATNAEALAGTDHTRAMTPLRVKEVVSRMDTGVWLISGSTQTYYGADGAAFNSALAAAGTGDIIRMGPGQYIVGAVSLSNKTGVSIIGSGALGRSNLTATSGATILAGSFSVAATSTQWTIKDLTIRRYAVTDSTNVFVVAGGTAAVHKGLIRNVSVIEPDALKSGSHIFECNGQDITIDNLHTYGPGTGGGHGFSVKCVQRIRITNCSSTGSGVDGILICADPTFGNSSDIFVDGFEVINPQANGCFINARDASTIDRLTIRNLFINGAPSGFSIGSATGTSVNNVITDVHVQAVGRNITGAGLSFIDVASSNVTFEVDLECVAAPIVNSFVDPGINANIHGRVKSANYGEVFFNRMPLNSMYQCQFESRFSPTRATSLGVASGRLRALEATTTTDLYVVITATYELLTANMVAGDPVWIEAGTASGVHKYVSAGTVDTLNVPITGAQVGDQYIRLTNSTAYTAGTKTAGNVRPGIVVGQFNSVQNVGSTVVADCNSASFSVGSYGLGRTAALVYYDAASTGEAVLGSTQSNLVPATTQASLTAHAWPFVYNATLYLGLFAGYSDQAAWIPYTSGTFNCSVTTRSTETSVGWKDASTIA